MKKRRVLVGKEGTTKHGEKTIDRRDDVHIVVLLKQVPDTESVIELNDTGTGVDRTDIKWVINPYDEYSLEEALLIRERLVDVRVTVLTAGDETAERSIRTAYALGVDEGIRIDTTAIPEPDSLGTAVLLAAALRKEGCDLVLAGLRAVDGDHYQVPAMVADQLGFPLISGVTRQQIESGVIRCSQAIDGGSARVEADLPVVLTTQKGINEPRYPNMRAMMQARKRAVRVLTLSDLGLTPDLFTPEKQQIRLVSLAYAVQRQQGRFIQGATAAHKAAELARLLKEETDIIQEIRK
ncbi:MAG: electron transfer flavoprotein subunit beta/FixA family protein [bacterium]